MRHLEVEPKKVESRLPPNSMRRKAASVWKGVALGVVLVVGAGYGLTAWLNPAPVDYLSEKRKSELLTEFTKLKGITVSPVSSGNVERALDSMRLDPSARQALMKRLEVGPQQSAQLPVRQTVLAELNLWDFASQDGDVVRVSSAGYEVEVSLLNQPTLVVVPVDETRLVKVQGVRDGGGGITLGIQNGAQKISLPVLAPAQVLSLPVN